MIKLRSRPSLKLMVGLGSIALGGALSAGTTLGPAPSAGLTAGSGSAPTCHGYPNSNSTGPYSVTLPPGGASFGSVTLSGGPSGGSICYTAPSGLPSPPSGVPSPPSGLPSPPSGLPSPPSGPPPSSGCQTFTPPAGSPSLPGGGGSGSVSASGGGGSISASGGSSGGKFCYKEPSSGSGGGGGSGGSPFPTSGCQTFTPPAGLPSPPSGDSASDTLSASGGGGSMTLSVGTSGGKFCYTAPSAPSLP